MNKLILAAPAILIGALAFSCLAQAQEPTNPVGFTLSCNIPAAQLTCSAQVSLPAGKRVVLQSVSARARAPSGQTVQLYVSTSSGNLPSGSIAARHYVVLTPTNSGTFGPLGQALSTIRPAVVPWLFPYFDSVIALDLEGESALA